MENFKRISLCLLLLLYLSTSVGQSSVISISDFDHTDFPSNQSIECLYEDSEGLLWIGTNSGLYQYDGNRIQHFQYDVFDSTSIPNNTIKAISEDSEGSIWIGTESFLVKHSRSSDSFHSYFKGKLFSHFSKGKQGEMFTIAENNILLQFGLNYGENAISHDTLLNTTVLDGEKVIINAVVHDDFDHRWLGTSRGLLSSNGNDLNQVGIDFPIHQILMGPDQVFWISSEDKLSKVAYDSQGQEVRILREYSLSRISGIIGVKISAVIERTDNTIWAGTNKGLFRSVTVNGNVEFKKLASSLDNVPVNCLIEDRNGNLWIGTQKGLKKYVRNAPIFNYVALENYNPTLHDVNVNSMHFDAKNSLWLGIPKELIVKFDASRNLEFTSYRSDIQIDEIKEGLNKEKFWATSGMNLYQIENIDNVHPETTIETELDIRIEDVIEFDNNEIWIGTWGQGILISDKLNSVSEFKKSVIDSSRGAYVSFIHQDKSKVIWLGTRGKGLYKIDLEKKAIRQFLPDIKQGITSNAFLSFCEDFNGDMWFGTRGGGLIYYNSENSLFTPYRMKDGLPSNTISALEQDHKNNIWMSTQNGIARLSNDDRSISSFGKVNGLEATQFMFESSAKSIDSRKIYFGSKGGFYEILCDNYVANKLIPSTTIRSLSVYNRETKDMQEGSIFSFTNLKDGKVKLPYNQNDISIEFTSSDLTAPSKNLYAYMLEGVNTYWINSTDQTRKADYYDLDPGEYVFKVKSTNSDGLWNDGPSEFSFEITPPLWLSNWAYLFYFICFIALIYGMSIAYRRWYKLKKNLLKETVSREKDNQFHKMRMVFFTDIAHELRTPLTLVLSSMEHFISKQSEGDKKKNAVRIFTNANKMKHLINQIMDIRKHGEGEFKLSATKCNAVEIIRAIHTNYRDLAKINEINLVFSAQQEEITCLLDLSILEKIVNNLLSNAVRHTAKSGRIDLRLSQVFLDLDQATLHDLKEGKYLRISIRDNGSGMTAQDLKQVFNRYYQSKNHTAALVKGTGIGLELVHKLVKLHHGAVHADSIVNNFTEFTVHLPTEAHQYKPEEVSKKKHLENFEFDLIRSASVLTLASKDQPVESVPMQQEGRILIVDDNTEFQNMLKEHLQDRHLIFTAGNGVEAMTVSKSVLPDLIICDIFMPEEDGLTFLKRIKKNHQLSHIPIIMLSGNMDEETKKESIQAGAEDFIEKPFSLEFLKWKISNNLNYQKSLKEIYSKKITAEPSSIEPESPDERLLKVVVEVIEKNISNPNLSVELLSSEVGMSRANLYRKIHKLMDDTPVNLIKTMRLKRAKQIIDLNKFYISEVAEMTGFKSQRYFSTCFQKEYDLTPMAYSKNRIVELNTADS